MGFRDARFERILSFAVVTVGLVAIPFAVYAGNSTNYDLNQERGGPVEYTGSSTNYDIKAEVGHPGVGESTSTNYVYDHGTIWFTSTSGVTVTVRWAVPELRVGATSTNDDTTFYLTIRTSNNSDNTILASMAYLATTSVDGTYATSINFGIASGTYDVGIKTQQHLTKIIQDVMLSDSTTTELNFTNDTNQPGVYGSGRLLAGDVSGAGTSPATLGDDVVNSVDMSIMLPLLDDLDPTGNGIRSNLNQDTVVNSVDLSIFLKNLDMTGER